MTEEKKDVDEADIAYTLGPAANYAIANCFFNFEPLGPIDSDIPVVYELELVVSTTTIVLLAGSKNPINSVFNQILIFFAMKAYDANLTAGELKIADYAILMVDKYEDIVDNLPKEEAYKELFFSNTENGSRNIPNISKNVPDTMCAPGDIRNHF